MILWGFLAACPMAAVAIGVIMARRRFVVVQVVGMSMAPALSPGDRVLVRRATGDQVRVGAVVVLSRPEQDCLAVDDLPLAWPDLAGTHWVIKRVAATQGDAVPESVRDAVRGADVVPPGMLVVLGDNARSTDSRTWGFVPAVGVLGNVVRRLPQSLGLGATAVKAIAQASDRQDGKCSVRINVLGPIKVVVEDRVIQLAGQRQRALLAALVLERGQAVAVDWLVDVLWDTSPPPTARARIQSHVSGLRQVIGHNVGGLAGPLLTQPPGYILGTEGVETDLALYDTLTAQAEEASAAGEPALAAELLAGALALWRGRAFADVDSQLIRAAAGKLEERRLLGVEAKAEADLARWRCDRVIAELSSWLSAHPFRERMRAMVMLALYRVGCRADALSLYREGHQLMVGELGIEPGPQLRELHRHILDDDPALLAPARPTALPVVENGQGLSSADQGDGRGSAARGDASGASQARDAADGIGAHRRWPSRP